MNKIVLSEYCHCRPEEVAEDQKAAFDAVLSWLDNEDAKPDEGGPTDNEGAQEHSARRLGAYRHGNALACGDWAGLVRLGIKSPEAKAPVLQVRPRSLGVGKSEVDLIAMFLLCLGDPVVATHLDRAVFIFNEQTPVECEEDLRYEALVFLVLIYLRELRELCLRHLRNQFIRISENLTGRVKGRINLAQQVRVNIPRARAEHMCCDFTVFSNNCRENQILKTALERSARLLSHFSSEMGCIANVWPWVHFCRNELAGVEEVEITTRLFQGLRYSGLFSAYREPHRLAKLILNLLPPDPQAKGTCSLTSAIPPFAICTYELFERYCEVKLREALTGRADIRLRAGYDLANLGATIKVRPDFLLCSGNPEDRWILDAKNIPYWPDMLRRQGSDEDYGSARAAVRQLCEYSRHEKVLADLRQNAPDTDVQPNMAILYPVACTPNATFTLDDVIRNENIPAKDDFPRLYGFPVPVPCRQAATS